MTEMDRIFYWYWFVNIPMLSNKAKSRLLTMFYHPSYIYRLSSKELSRCLSTEQVERIIHSKDEKALQRSFKHLQEENSRFIHWESKDYPDNLRNIYDPPYGLYLKGRVPDYGYPTVAIVGSRRPTPYGLRMAGIFAKTMTKHGIIVVSGLAAGIDAAAHRGALEGDGQTIGILGGGIDTMYPKNNMNLYLEMYARGTVMSEYNIGIPNKPGLFPLRNRLISGMSDAVFVVEAGEKSGSLITADSGMEQGKDIYALPGRTTDYLSQGCNHLITEGAHLAADPEEVCREIIEDWNIFHQNDIVKDEYNKLIGNTSSKKNKRNLIFETEEERKIYQYLDEIVPVSFNELMEKTRIDLEKLQHLLIRMELSNHIYQPMQNIYLKKIF